MLVAVDELSKGGLVSRPYLLHELGVTPFFHPEPLFPITPRVCKSSHAHNDTPYYLKIKDLSVKLAEEVGFEAIDFGKLSEARLLESLALTWIKLAYQCGQGREIALALLRR
jgi:hypothetical protein